MAAPPWEYLNAAIIEQVEKGKFDIETFFSSENTPSYVVDPITDVLFKHPVVCPSGKSVSRHVAAGKPGIDIFSNLPFSPGQIVVPNLHLKDAVDEYMDNEMIHLIKERKDLNCASNARRLFLNKFQQDIHLLLPFTCDLNDLEKKVLFASLEKKMLFESVVWDSQLRELVLRLLESNKDTFKFICSQFLNDKECYKALDISTMLKSTGREKAVKLVLSLSQHWSTNILIQFSEIEGADHLWDVLRCAAKVLAKEHFYYLCRHPVITIDLDKVKDLSPEQFLITVEQECKITNLQQLLQRSLVSHQREFSAIYKAKLQETTELQQKITQLQKQHQEQTQHLQQNHQQSIQQAQHQIQQLKHQIQQLQQLIQQNQQEIAILTDTNLQLHQNQPSISNTWLQYFQPRPQVKPQAEVQQIIQKITRVVDQNSCGNWGSLYYCGGRCDIRPIYRCTAARHAGFSPGFFVVQSNVAMRKMFTSSTSNSITSHAYRPQDVLEKEIMLSHVK